MSKKSINDAFEVAANQKPVAPGKPPEVINNDDSLLAQSGRTDSVFDGFQSKEIEPEPTSEQQPKPDYLTREQFQSEVDGTVRKIVDDLLGRYSQSFADKFTNRLKGNIEAEQKRTKTLIDMQRASGQAISEEQEKALLQQVALNELVKLRTTEPNSEPPAPDNPPAKNDGSDESVIKTSYAILQGIGVSDITEDEPEYKMLDFAALQRDDEAAWYKSITAAGMAKKARDSKPARTLPSSGGTPPGNDADIIAAKLEKLRTDPLRNKEEIEKLLKELI